MIKVSLYASRCSFPVQFARHHWFVIDRNGVFSRWEVVHWKDKGGTSWGHLHKDLFKPFDGLPKSIFSKNTRWPSHKIGSIEGDGSSIAARIADFIENTPNTYPFCHMYSFLGPNSNTFVQWILAAFPDFNVTLPKNAIGKNYKVML